jgi:hypothetical protein
LNFFLLLILLQKGDSKRKENGGSELESRNNETDGEEKCFGN